MFPEDLFCCVSSSDIACIAMCALSAYRHRRRLWLVEAVPAITADAHTAEAVAAVGDDDSTTTEAVHFLPLKIEEADGLLLAAGFEDVALHISPSHV